MPDDLDNQIRAAMKSLDEQVPSGYFEALPNQILARLEDGSMQHSGSTDIRDKRDQLMGPPVVATNEPDTAPTAKVDREDRDEDSGLHDIRNLAQSTKQRLSSRRITQNPPVADDVLASSSGSWKNIALPQPAKMVSLPEIAELPTKAEVIAAEKAAAKELAEKTKKAARKKGESVTPATLAASASSDEVLAPNASANLAVASMAAAPVPERQPSFSLPSMERKSSKGPLIALLGLGVAAAAGGVIYMQTQKSEKTESAASAQAPASADVIAKAEPAPPPPAPTPAPEAAAAAAPVEVAAAGSAAPVDPPAMDTKTEEAPPADEEKVATKTGGKKAGKGGKKGLVVEKEDKPVEAPKVEEKKAPEPPKTEPKKPGAKEGEGEPSFDALLKEAGVEDKKEVKPKLEKKSLSGDDFKKGMAAISGKAQGCYKGTQGTAMVKLTVSPSGSVTKAAVTGQFAGTPEGSCVESAVKGASFPAWDGGPQSFTYSYMLAD